MSLYLISSSVKPLLSLGAVHSTKACSSLLLLVILMLVGADGSAIVGRKLVVSFDKNFGFCFLVASVLLVLKYRKECCESNSNKNFRTVSFYSK